MQIYLCARFGRHEEMQEFALVLQAAGHTVVSRWIKADHEIRSGGHSNDPGWMAVWAQEDKEDLANADVLITFTEGPGMTAGRANGGRHVEFGMALAWGIPTIVVGTYENVFHYLPQVFVCQTQMQAIEILDDLAHRRNDG